MDNDDTIKNTLLQEDNMIFPHNGEGEELELKEGKKQRERKAYSIHLPPNLMLKIRGSAQRSGLRGASALIEIIMSSVLDDLDYPEELLTFISEKTKEKLKRFEGGKNQEKKSWKPDDLSDLPPEKAAEWEKSFDEVP